MNLPALFSGPDLTHELIYFIGVGGSLVPAFILFARKRFAFFHWKVFWFFAVELVFRHEF